MNSTPAAIPPARTNEQRLEALREANRIRVYRAQMKVRILEGGTSVLDLRHDPDMATAKVVEFLLAERGIGRVRAHRMLQVAACSPSKTFAGITDRQWDAITRLVTATPQFHRNHPNTRAAA